MQNKFYNGVFKTEEITFFFRAKSMYVPTGIYSGDILQLDECFILIEEWNFFSSGGKDCFAVDKFKRSFQLYLFKEDCICLSL